jgi:hypothetical protein
MIFTNTTSGSKVRYTAESDAALIKLSNEGKDRAAIAAAIGHPENSVTYRLRTLKARAVAGKFETVEELLASIKY